MANSYDQQQALHANPSPESYMLSNSSESGAGTTVHPKFTEVTAENLKVLCKTLENRVPHHEDIVADIASVVLQCRSGMMTRGTRRHREKPDLATWLLFHGRDTDGKKAVAQELARLVFGSYTNFISISLSNYTPVHSKSSSGEVILKRQRSLGNGPHGYVQRLYDTILENPHRVIMIDGVDQLDCESEVSIRSAITNGRITSCNGGEASLEDAIVILSCETLDDSRSTGSSPRLNQRAIDNEGDEEGNCRTNIEKGSEPYCFIFDLNACVEDGEGDNEGGASDIPHTVDGLFLFQVTTEDL
jgi:ATP-dependent Clp protease ATP-binding subunit ClpA